MNLGKKKKLAARRLGVGVRRIKFDESRLTEIKEAITGQDIKDLKKDNAITIKEVKGRRRITKRKHKRGPGKVRKRKNERKQKYVKLTRKLRAHIKGLKNKSEIDSESYKKIRKQIRAKTFRSKSHLKESLKKE